MNTNSLKKFAAEARNILIQGVKQRLVALGFAADGKATEEPQQHEGGATFMGNVVSNDFYTQWMSLQRAIGQRGIKEVAEEAAYTWFNRLVAIRILVKNGLIAPVLAYESEDVHIPVLVSEARQGRLPQMDEQSLRQWEELKDDDSKTDRQFALLIVAFCHATPILHQCFGRITDYTELLLPTNILSEGGLVDLLNHTSFISEEDYRSPELIGWLYQFYISEKKDEVFAKKGKFEADEIPAATQIFTPNWIVKYMVQNTVGRIYLDNNPYSELKETMAYLVGDAVSHCINIDSLASSECGETNINNLSSSECGETPHLLFSELTDLKVADLACGSGHILNECFDLLYQCYMEEGYSRRQAVEDIFRYNLTGIDLDTRAKQLATFSLLLKACQKDSSFVDAHCLPKVLDMANVVPDMNEQELSEACLRFIGGYEDVAGEMLEQDFELLRDAGTLGSIMKFNDDEDYLAMLRYHYEDWTNGGIEDCPEEIQALIPGVRVILALTEEYHALVMNPPYMGSGNMNATLSKYVKDNYADGKADLATVFVQMMGEKIVNQGFYAFIIPPSWMFLSAFEGLRKRIIENKSIRSLLHLSRGVFGADFGASSAVIQNDADSSAKGTYFRLVERTFQEFEQSHLRMLFEQTLANHDFKYRFKDYTKDITELPYSEDGLKIYYPNISQKDFEKIPGCPIGYSISSKIANSFQHKKMDSYSKPSKGMMPGSDYLRFFWEIACQQIETKVMNHTQSMASPLKWYPYFKGGSFRRWYGNKIYVVDYQFDGARVKAGDRNPAIYFKDNINWSKIASGLYSARKGEQGSLYDDAACQCYVFDNNNYLYLLGLLNSKYAQSILWCKSQTFNYVPSEIAQIPVVIDNNKKNSLDTLVQQNISISKLDWDAHETSWDFEANPLLAIGGAVSHCTTETDDSKSFSCSTKDGAAELNCGGTPQLLMDSTNSSYCGGTPQLLLEDLMNAYKQKWEHLFMQLHENEEELNRQFIDIYGLQDELTPDVPLEEVTILQQGEISIES